MKCPVCGTEAGTPDWKAYETYLWANQYGYGKRLFCSCGYYTDFRCMNSEAEATIIRSVPREVNGALAYLREISKEEKRREHS